MRTLASESPRILSRAAGVLPALRGRLEPAIAAALVVGYLLLFSWLSVRRHQTYHSLGADLGLFDQIFWNTVHGRPFESTMSLAWTDPHSFFADHLTLYRKRPVYWYLQTPKKRYGVWIFHERLTRDTGMSYLNCAFAVGQIPHERILNSMRLFAKEIMPQFRDYVPDQAAYPRGKHWLVGAGAATARSAEELRGHPG